MTCPPSIGRPLRKCPQCEGHQQVSSEQKQSFQQWYHISVGIWWRIIRAFKYHRAWISIEATNSRAIIRDHRGIKPRSIRLIINFSTRFIRNRNRDLRVSPNQMVQDRRYADLLPWIIPSHLIGYSNSARDKFLWTCQNETRDPSLESSPCVDRGHTILHRIRAQALYAWICKLGSKTLCIRSWAILATTKLRIHNAWAGLAIWPTAERVRRTSVPKSMTGSIMLRPIASLGWMCRINVDPSGKTALRTKQPCNPLESSLSWWEKPHFLHPQGHGRVWDPQAWRAHGDFEFWFNRYLPCFPSATPNARISWSSRANSCSSESDHRQMSGITCWTWQTSGKGGHACNLTGPTSGEVKTHHARCRRHGQIESNRSSVWLQWNLVFWTNLEISACTKLSWAAGANAF